MNRLVLSFLFVVILCSFSHAQDFVQEGIASFYADKFEGRLTASGEKYKHSKYTAAHKTLPFGTIVKVTNLSNSKFVEVKINDRGPYVDGRIIDLSKLAAESLDMIGSGLTKVKVEIVNAGDGKGNDYRTGSTGQTDLPEEEREFYEFSVARTKPAGFGVQIGSYRELANLVRLADNLKASYKKKVTVQVSVIKDVKLYKIIVGQEKTREKADQLKGKLKNRYPDSFIVKFKDI
jgi:rare lipoprotein A